MAGTGGKRPGAGRPRGVPNKVTKQRSDIAAKALKAERTPLHVMLAAMDAAYEVGGPMAAAPFAKDAAPYVHPKLANIEHAGKDGGAIKHSIAIEFVK